MSGDRQHMRSRQLWWSALAITAFAALAPAKTRAQQEFPFEVELLLDEKPLPGSKRVPMMEINDDGRAMIDLWCFGGSGLVEISRDKIKVTFTQMRPQGGAANCTPDRQQRDEELGLALTRVTQWRKEDDVIVFIGPTELRFRISSH
jgi:hypothetical protein